MPETRGERITFGIGIIAIAALVALIVLEATDLSIASRTSRTSAVRDVTTATTVRDVTTATTTRTAPPTADSVTTAPEPTTDETTTAPERFRPAARGVRLTLSATADTWLEVRTGTAEGRVLYSGILAQGRARRFEGARLWARFGAASNLAARLNGNPLHLPAGTYSVLVGARGLRLLGR
jgi:cytoskeletal protein RodZ